MTKILILSFCVFCITYSPFCIFFLHLFTLPCLFFSAMQSESKWAYLFWSEKHGSSCLIQCIMRLWRCAMQYLQFWFGLSWVLSWLGVREMGGLVWGVLVCSKNILSLNPVWSCFHLSSPSFPSLKSRDLTSTSAGPAAATWLILSRFAVFACPRVEAVVMWACMDVFGSCVSAHSSRSQKPLQSLSVLTLSFLFWLHMSIRWPQKLPGCCGSGLQPLDYRLTVMMVTLEFKGTVHRKHTKEVFPCAPGIHPYRLRLCDLLRFPAPWGWSRLFCGTQTVRNLHMKNPRARSKNNTDTRHNLQPSGQGVLFWTVKLYLSLPY